MTGAAGIMERRCTLIQVWYDANSYILLARKRYLDFYGEPGAYLGPPDQVDREAYKQLRTPLITLLSPLLFFAPDVHYLSLHQLCYDGITKEEWSVFIRKLSTEWQDFDINVRPTQSILELL